MLFVIKHFLQLIPSLQLRANPNPQMPADLFEKLLQFGLIVFAVAGVGFLAIFILFLTIIFKVVVPLLLWLLSLAFSKEAAFISVTILLAVAMPKAFRSLYVLTWPLHCDSLTLLSKERFNKVLEEKAKRDRKLAEERLEQERLEQRRRDIAHFGQNAKRTVILTDCAPCFVCC